MKKALISSIFITASILFSGLFAQSWYNHSELTWMSIETDHFIVHYHETSERCAREAAAVAEKIYGPITSVYQFEPNSKTHLVIQDTDDYSNGAAYYYDNKIIIWALPLDFDLRGSHRWMQNVITHEFTHIVQIQASMKYSRQVPGTYLQYMGYEDEKRDDVLYGFPNMIISYPIPGTSVPPWLAEGTAQHMYEDANFDFWDSHRDMIIRDKTVNHDLFDFHEMNTFGKRGIGNECVYNHGFGFVEYLVDRFGEDVLRKVSESLSKPLNYSIRKALKDATAIDGIQLHSDWEKHLDEDYHIRLDHVIENEVKGDVLEASGTTNVHPVWSPDETRFAFLSNKENDYFSQTDLFLYDFEEGKSEKIQAGVHTAPTWIDDNTLVYAKRNKPNRNGSRFFDLFRYDLSTEEEDRLTHDARLTSPIYNSETHQLAAISSYDGTSNIMISQLDTINFKPVTHQTNGIQMFSLSWGPDNTILFDAVEQHGRKVYSVDIESGEIEILTGQMEDLFDTRDPIYVGDDHNSSGITSLCADNSSGIHNLKINFLADSRYITNVVGGAFMPDISSDGRILYSLYEHGTYKIAILKTRTEVESDLVGYSPDYYSQFAGSDFINYGVDLPARPYKDTMTKPFILPRLMVDYKTVKPGFYIYASDVLDHLLVFGGASLNKLGDRDLFLMFDFKKFNPTLYANMYWISRNISQNLMYQIIYPVESDLTIKFFAADLGMRFPVGIHKFWLQYNYTKYTQTINQVVREADHTIVGAGDLSFDYYRGHNLSLRWQLKARKAEFAGNMLPSNGYEIDSKLAYEWNNFMEGFSFNDEYSHNQPNFVANNTTRLTIDAAKHWTINRERKIVSSLSTKLEVISNPEIDDFFHFYGGGMIGMKGYTFYDSTLSGSALLINTAVVRMPVFMEQSIPLAHMNLQNFTIGLIGQAGGGFSGKITDWISDQNYKLSSGVELRLSGYSFYAYPTALSYEYHMPINDTDTKGKHYLTLLFGF